MKRLYIILSISLLFIFVPGITSYAMTDDEMINYAIVQYNVQKEGLNWHDINDDMHYLIAFARYSNDIISLYFADKPADEDKGIQQGIIAVKFISEGYPQLAQWYNGKWERVFTYTYTISTNKWVSKGTAYLHVEPNPDRSYRTNKNIEGFFLAPALPLETLMEQNLANLQPFLGGIVSQVLPICLRILAILLLIVLIIYCLRLIILKKQ